MLTFGLRATTIFIRFYYTVMLHVYKSHSLLLTEWNNIRISQCTQSHYMIRTTLTHPPVSSVSATAFFLLFFLQEWRSQALPVMRGDLPTPLWAAQLRAACGEPLEGLPRLLRAVPPQLSAAALREARPHALWRPRAQLWADRMKDVEGRTRVLTYFMGKCVLSAISSFWLGFG